MEGKSLSDFQIKFMEETINSFTLMSMKWGAQTFHLKKENQEKKK